MDYHYENLTDEQFQELCSALIKRLHPTSQAFPVGQRDGGRDSVYYTSDNGHGKFDVYQVKFVRVAKLERDVHKWLLTTLEGERSQVEILKGRGLQKYFLLTNVSGTAFPNSGSIDQANRLLKEKFEVEGVCWWRDDLSRTLEAYPELKWSYPQILSGQDLMLVSLLNTANDTNKRRRQSIELYLLEQYLHDKDVKFQQVDLESRLLDLFVDVPLRIKHHSKKDQKLQYIKENFSQANHGIYHEETILNLTAAQFCLRKEVQESSPVMLIEGGPGQGKSTISQYICQIHRSRLLNKIEDVEKISEQEKNAPIKLPFKIDLRDLASWINKKNPYSISDEYFNSKWIGTMEAFLTTHIYAHTNISDYTTNDLFDTLRETSPLFVFDGFDEVADIKTRSSIIAMLTKWIEKVAQYNKHAQTIITSRPAAFSNVATFPVDRFPHYELTHLNDEIKVKYIDRWIKSKELSQKSAADLKNLTIEKIKNSHLKDFGRSPMQLAILLSLILTKGQSLPSQRTALYDSYIGLFLDREAEKNEVIRNNRNLIIGVHEYLAWILHSEAELYKRDGRIELHLLKAKLESYLLSEGHNTIILDELFTAMQERVCALVARIQGTFEFEIQSLREYFCAKYLYNTSKSSYNSPSKGSLPDIFEALCKNSYWLNVLRYFCGCVKKSELATLHFKLMELHADDVLKYSTYPIQLTLQLLGDRVFDNYPKLRSQVIELLITNISHTSLVGTIDYYGDNQMLQLTSDCGGKELEQKGFKLLAQNIDSEYARDYLSLINENKFDTFNIWKDYAINLSGKNLTTWIRHSLSLGLIRLMENKFINDNVLSDPEELENRFIIVNQKFDILNGNYKIKEKLINHILNDRYYSYHGNIPKDYKEFFRRIETIYHYSFFIKPKNENETLNSVLEKRYRSDENKIISLEPLDVIDKKIVEFNIRTNHIFEKSIAVWKKDKNLWKEYIDIGTELFGDASIFKISAFNAGKICKSKYRNTKHKNIINELHICDLIDISVTGKNSEKYWHIFLEEYTDNDMYLLLLLTWASPEIIINITNQYPNLLKKCNIEQLIRELSMTSEYNNFSKKQTIDLKHLLKDKEIGNILKYLLSLRLEFDIRTKFLVDHVENDELFLTDIVSTKMYYHIKLYLSDTKNIQVLKDIESLYAEINIRNIYYFDLFDEVEEYNQTLALEQALHIRANSSSYPRILVSMAERSLTECTFKSAAQVGKIATDDNWFDY